MTLRILTHQRYFNHFTLARSLRRTYATTQDHLFLGNLSPSVAEADLESIFSKYGQIAGVKIIKALKRDAASKQVYAFVRFTDAGVAQKALEANGTLLHGAPIAVEIATGKKPRKESV